MRKIILPLIILLFATATKAQYVNIPDSNFRNFLVAKYPACFNASGQMDTTCSAIVNEDSLVCEFLNITNLSGIEYFDNLVILDCSYNNLTQLPNSLPNNLIQLICESNQLASLPTLPKKLFRLWAANNKITSIQPLSSSLDDIGLGGNLLTTIPNIPRHARFFGCGLNPNLYCLPPLPDSLNSFTLNIYFDTANIKCLPNLPYGCIINGVVQSYPVCNTSYNPNNCTTYPIRPMVDINDEGFAGYLVKMCRDCFGRGNGFWDSVSNYFGGMPQRLDTSTWITKVKTLSPINSSIQNLSDIKYFNQLEVLDVSDNAIKFIPILPKKLKEFNAPRNFTIDSIVSPLPDSLTILELNNNKIKELPSLPNTLKALYVEYNNFNCLPYLPNGLLTLFYDTSKIKCLPNIPSGLGLTYPVCNATNNPNNCPILAAPPAYVNIPDTSFGKFLLAKYPICLYKDSAANKYYMDTTCSGVVNETYVDCSNKNIVSLEGIQYLKKMRELHCSHNQIVFIPILTDSLEWLYCQFNNLDSLPKLPAKLTFFNCSHNKIKELKSQTFTLQPFSSFIEFNCSYNMLTKLPGYLNTNVSSFNCSYNQISGTVVLPWQGDTLDCSHNSISKIQIIGDIGEWKYWVSINCSNNLLKTLPFIHDAQPVKINCSHNLLTSFNPYDVPFVTNIDYCNMREVNLSFNDISCLSKLPPTLTKLTLDANEITCLPNRPLNLLVYDTNNTAIQIPICNASNNPHQCISYPMMQGIVYNDFNKDSVLNGADNRRKNVKILLPSGGYTFTNDSGYYRIWADSLGYNTITIIPPNFYNAVPTTVTNYFYVYDDSVSNSIALQTTFIKDSVTISAGSFGKTRPAATLNYGLYYENVGTTTIRPTISFKYDTANIVYASSTNATVTNNADSLGLLADSLKPGQSGYFVASFIVKQTAVIGDTIKHSATIFGGSATANSNGYSIVRGSFDPNDKTATPELSTTQVAAGKKIDYTIRFQNTGTDTAFHVVIADTLDSKLDYSTLQMVATSHNCKTTIKNNVIFFEMRNIMLPDSNVNKLGSNGFIRFTMQPKSTVVAGNNIPNKAAIYFDYNAPVITNTAITQIKNPLLPVRITNYEASPTPPKEGLKNWTILNKWTTSSEVNTSHFVIQRSEDGRVFKSVGTVAAKGNGTYNFTDALTITHSPLTIYYRLQVVDKDGSYSFSEIKQIRLNQLTDKQINIYPNPATAMVTIDCKDAKQLLIIDNLGRTIQQFNKITEHQTLNAQQLNKGIYVVKVITNNGEIKTEKLIVE